MSEETKYRFAIGDCFLFGGVLLFVAAFILWLLGIWTSDSELAHNYIESGFLGFVVACVCFIVGGVLTAPKAKDDS
jgi:hypothetical protein